MTDITAPALAGKDVRDPASTRTLAYWLLGCRSIVFAVAAVAPLQAPPRAGPAMVPGNPQLSPLPPLAWGARNRASGRATSWPRYP
ncbi:heme A synthase, partial [Azospirillum brasilense]|nr:heme A synthase [Azospirillum argentinense]